MAEANLDPPGRETERRTAPVSAQDAICRNVLAILGRPVDFLRISIRQVTNSDFRVNVLTGAELATARIAHSYFVTANEDGLVTASLPAIVRRY